MLIWIVLAYEAPQLPCSTPHHHHHHHVCTLTHSNKGARCPVGVCLSVIVPPLLGPPGVIFFVTHYTVFFFFLLTMRSMVVANWRLPCSQNWGIRLIFFNFFYWTFPFHYLSLQQQRWKLFVSHLREGPLHSFVMVLLWVSTHVKTNSKPKKNCTFALINDEMILYQ